MIDLGQFIGGRSAIQVGELVSRKERQSGRRVSLVCVALDWSRTCAAFARPASLTSLWGGEGLAPAGYIDKKTRRVRRDRTRTWRQVTEYKDKHEPKSREPDGQFTMAHCVSLVRDEKEMRLKFMWRTIRLAGVAGLLPLPTLLVRGNVANCRHC